MPANIPLAAAKYRTKFNLMEHSYIPPLRRGGGGVSREWIFAE